MKKLRFTEEFLWQLHKILEVADSINKELTVHSLKDVLHPEWRELRFAYEKKKRARSFTEFISYLRKMGYLKVPTGESVGEIYLTPKGKEKALLGQKKTRTLSSRKDGKMVMLMYDIPKRKQHVRQVFRSALEFLGYVLLQKSVWVSDRDVLEDTERVVRENGLNECVNLFIIERIKLQK